jgi:hypothetical protein
MDRTKVQQGRQLQRAFLFRTSACFTLRASKLAISALHGFNWEGRFKSQLLTSQEGVILCQTYIDLNPIRAGIATTPEESRLTSACDHIDAMQNKIKVKAAIKLKKQGHLLSDEKNKDIRQAFKDRNKDKWLAPFYKGEGHKKCFYLNVSQEEYLSLLDWSGRTIKKGKSGAIPTNLLPIFDRLQLDRELWIESLQKYDKWFFNIVGKFEAIWSHVTDMKNHVFKDAAINRKIFK